MTEAMKYLTLTITLCLAAMLTHAGTPTGLTLRNVASLARATPPAATVSTSYANSGGTGSRTGSITVTTDLNVTQPGNITKLVDGVTSAATDLYLNNVQAVSGKVIRFNLGTTGYAKSYVINEAKFYQQSSTSQGTWKWQGSINGTTWVDIGSSLTLGSSATQTMTELSGNTTAYQYYQLLGVSGNTNSGPFVYEMEFKISALVDSVQWTADPTATPGLIVAGSHPNVLSLSPAGTVVLSSGSATRTYQWQGLTSGYVNIGSATSATYTTVDDTYGAYQCIVTATGPSGLKATKFSSTVILE
jgi:hypothetical protein